MGFNRRKMEDERRRAAEKKAAERRATDAQVFEDAERLGRLHIDHKLPAATCIGSRESHSKANEHSGR